MFKHFRQNLRAYPKVKKNLDWQWLGKCCILGKIWAKRDKSLICPKYSWGSGGSQNSRKISSNFSPFKFGNSISKHFVPANKICNQWGVKLFSESRKTWKCNIGLLYSKNPQFLSFSWIARFKNPKISLLIGKNLEVQA